MRLLFCVPTTALSGGTKVNFEFANRLRDAGDDVELFSFAGAPRWFPLKAPILAAKDFADVRLSDYDFVLVSNAFMLPMVLPHLGSARCLFFSLDYESFHHSPTKSYADFMTPSSTLDELYKLPVPIIAGSRAVQQLIREHTGRDDAFYVSMGIDKAIFRPQPRQTRPGVKRICLVGNYLMPYKGMQDGLVALTRLAAEMEVQLVLVTQEQRGRDILAGLPFPVEIHYCPTDAQLPAIYASCDVYCCTSWYEGLGLPALECFCCGTPVVSTRTYGVNDYGVDDHNLLLARPHDPDDLYKQLRRLLRDGALSERLRQSGFATVAATYDWAGSVTQFRQILHTIDRSYRGAGPANAAAMQALLDRLEQEGNLTPIPVWRYFRHLETALQTIIDRLMMAGPSPDALTELESLRDGFRRYVGNQAAEYYDSFKAQYDLCRLLLSLADRPHFSAYLKLIMDRRQARAHAAPATLSEIRYREPQP